MYALYGIPTSLRVRKLSTKCTGEERDSSVMTDEGIAVLQKCWMGFFREQEIQISDSHDGQGGDQL